jgi:FAD/FMN-containing dehydrogenase
VAQPTTLAEERVEQIRANPEGHRYAVDNAWLTGTPDEVAPRLVKAFTTLPSEKAFSLWFDFAHAPKPADMALSLQTTIYFASYVVWEDEKDDERCRAWLDERMADLAPVSVGCYLGDSDFTRRPAQFLSDEAYERLERIRAARDPHGRFVGYLGRS